MIHEPEEINKMEQLLLDLKAGKIRNIMTMAEYIGMEPLHHYDIIGTISFLRAMEGAVKFHSIVLDEFKKDINKEPKAANEVLLSKFANGSDCKFKYTNYRGETSIRNARIIEFVYGSTEYHPEPQILIVAWDYDKNEQRKFALKDCDFMMTDMDDGK